MGFGVYFLICIDAWAVGRNCALRWLVRDLSPALMMPEGVRLNNLADILVILNVLAKLN